MPPPQTRILLMGVEPLSGCALLSSTITSPSPSPNFIPDGPKLKSELEASFARCRAEPDLHVDICWFHPSDSPPAARLAAQLKGNPPYDVLVVGWGVRALAPFRELFEDVIDVIREWAPRGSRVMFSDTNSDHLETVRRGE